MENIVPVVEGDGEVGNDRRHEDLLPILQEDGQDQTPEEPEIPAHEEGITNSTNVDDLVQVARLAEAMHQQVQEEAAVDESAGVVEDVVEERKPSLFRSLWDTLTNFFKKFFRKNT